MNGRKTYWHLEHLQRKPTDYEIATTKLLYYPSQGFEVQTPGAAWYARYQTGSPLRCRDWERFSDPRETTYAKYMALQAEKEAYIDGLLGSVDERGSDTELDPAWLEQLSNVFAPLRYPVHGLQMIAAYVGQMAPSGRIAAAALFQTADELRRTQHIAMRMRQLQRVQPNFGSTSKELWQNAPIWQPWRELVELLLVTYDWGEALIALNFAVKPMFDELFMTRLADLARHEHDDLLAEILRSLDQDCQWHREWSRTLAVMLAEDAGNLERIRGWLEKWHPRAQRAVVPIAAALGLSPGAAERADAFCRDYWRAAGLVDAAR